MSKVKINSVDFEEIKTYVKNAIEYEEKAMECWGDEFEDLYYAFVTSGFLESLYEDAKSNFYQIVRTSTVISCSVGIVASALQIAVNPVGGIIGIVLSIVGIVSVCATDPTWVEVSKEAFIALLTECVNGTNECYIRLKNTNTKLANVYVSMEEIRSKINEFNHIFANMEETLDEFNLKGTMTDDGVLLSIDTEITVDGQIVTTSVSEALNAFYTYTSTVMASRIEAEYISKTYGIDIDYESLVKNANGFITSTLKSGLYSHEFVNHILPTYNITASEATSTAAGNLGLTTSEFESVLNKAGSIIGSIGAGLLGANLIGKLNKGGVTTPPSGTPTDPTYGGTTTPTGPVTTTPGKETPTNKVEIEKISEVKLPEKVEDKVTKDYDDLVRREYEALGEEEISKRRLEIMEEVDKAFESGDLTAIKAKLKEYGYSDPEIEAICADRDKLMLALVEGDQRAYMAEKALELAKADGIENYDTTYDDGQKYSDLTDGTSNVLLANMSADEKVSEAFDVFTKAEEVYVEKVATATAAVEAALLSKTALDEMKAKFVQEFGTEDTTKWSEEAANKYNEAVKDYNKKAEDAKAKLDEKDKAKEEYDEAKEDYEEAKVDFADRIKKGLNGENPEEGTPGDGTQTPGDGTTTPGDGTTTPGEGTNGGTQYIPVDGEMPYNPGVNPGIGLDMIPDDNALYATENLGANGLYEEVIPGSGVSKDSYVDWKPSTGDVTINNQTSVGSGTTSNVKADVTVSIDDSKLDAKDLFDLAKKGTPVASSVDTSIGNGYSSADLNIPSNTQGSVVSNGNGTNTVTISDAELIAALMLQEEEAKYK